MNPRGGSVSAVRGKWAAWTPDYDRRRRVHNEMQLSLAIDAPAECTIDRPRRQCLGLFSTREQAESALDAWHNDRSDGLEMSEREIMEIESSATRKIRTLLADAREVAREFEIDLDDEELAALVSECASTALEERARLGADGFRALVESERMNERAIEK